MNCFKTYDIRGVVPEQLNAQIAYKLGLAVITVTGATRVAVGRDCRHSSPQLTASLIRGLAAAGATVLDLGLCGSEEVYFASCQPGVQAAVMVTASHNPAPYNGMKIVRAGGVPLSEEEFARLQKVAPTATSRGPVGRVVKTTLRHQYCGHLERLAGDIGRRLRVVCNAGNGCAGLLFGLLSRFFDVIPVLPEPDGNFPHGVPNPMLKEQRRRTADRVVAEQADLGLAWDTDFDRCFFFDEKGKFVESYHLSALLATIKLQQHPGAVVLHDSRLTWCVREQVERHGGRPICCLTGHVHLKRAMHQHDAIYGGEMSGHHYFRELSGIDSGMLVALQLGAWLSRTRGTLSDALAELRHRYRVSGEQNFRVADVQQVLQRVERLYPDAQCSHFDGLSLEFPRWRCNLRPSNTEPLLRLNVEARENQRLVTRVVREISQAIYAENCSQMSA